VGERSTSTIVVWALAAMLAALAGMRLLGGDEPAPAPVSIDGARGPAVAAGGARGSASPAAGAGAERERLYVHVAGAVHRPGLIRLPPGTRVAIALERAGGPTRRADLTLVNLAAQVQDGQQIVVPARGAGGTAAGGETAAAGGGTAAAGGGLPGTATGPPVHLSTATVEQLDEIDGIGPTLAARIVEYRDSHGGFRSIEELSEIEGIGEKRLATLRDAVQP
jgi:competence protein ComEA